MNVIRDIPYSDSLRCKLDIYQPVKGRQNRILPVVMVVHGGAWMIGDKKKTESVCRAIISAGMIAVAPNYQLSTIPFGGIRQTLWWSTICTPLVLLACRVRTIAIVCMIATLFVIWVMFTVWLNMITPEISSDNPYPSHIGDIERVLDWVEHRISGYQGDDKCIMLLGHSAGAHLVSLLAIRRSMRPDNPVRGVICISGVYSHDRLREITCGEWLTRCAFGKQDDYIPFFPVYNIHKQLPPHFIINAKWDLSLIKHSWDMVSVLKAHGIYVRFEYFEGNHFSIMKNWDHDSNRCVWRSIREFLTEVVDLYMDPPPGIDESTQANVVVKGEVESILHSDSYPL